MVKAQHPKSNTHLTFKSPATSYSEGQHVLVYDNSGHWREAIISQVVALGVLYRFNTPDALKYRPDFASFDRVRPLPGPGKTENSSEENYMQSELRPKLKTIEPLRDGERVRMIADLPADWSGPAAGTEGVVITEGGKRGFQPDGEATLHSVHVGAKIKRNEKAILYYCERIPDPSPVFSSKASSQAERGEPATSSVPRSLDGARDARRSPQGFYDGQRVRLTADGPGHMPLSKGDEGVAVAMRDVWGFQAIGRLGAVSVLDQCEAIPDTPEQLANRNALQKSDGPTASAEFQPTDPLPEASKVNPSSLIASLQAENALLNRQRDALQEERANEHDRIQTLAKRITELEQRNATLLKTNHEQSERLRDHWATSAASSTPPRQVALLPVKSWHTTIGDWDNATGVLEEIDQFAVALPLGWTFLASQVVPLVQGERVHYTAFVTLHKIEQPAPAQIVIQANDDPAQERIDAANTELKDTMKAAFIDSAEQFKPMTGGDGV